MDEFIKLLKETYDNDKKIQEIENLLNTAKNKASTHFLYDVDFALACAKSVVDNKLDLESVLITINYCLSRAGIIEVENIKEKSVMNKVEYLYNISKLDLSSKEEIEVSINKMFLNMAKDIRVVIIKLCIETEKLNFLDRFSSDRVDRLMKSYRDIYSPIASMLGLSRIKDILEEATFKYFNPKFYADLSETLKTYVQKGKEAIDLAVEKIKTELTPIIPNVKVYGRQKKISSIAKKLQKKNMYVDSIQDVYGSSVALDKAMTAKSFKEVKLAQIVDILALRVLVNTVEECYMVLGKVFSLFTPIGNFKDYISHPKENGYQSLHTLVMLDNGYPLEIQIRTFAMHTFAEYGMASHWAYKAKTQVKESDYQINHIRQLLDYYKDKPSYELYDAMKTDFYSGMIYVQTPLGKIIELPEGSTPVDFAYAIHSNVGNKCVGAKINDTMVPLNAELHNGDIVEILTNVNAKGPSRDWLKIVKTQTAKSKINTYFKKQMKEDNIKKGKSILEEHAKTLNLNLSKLLVDKYLQAVYERYSLSSIDDMYASLGYGGLTSNQILNKLVATQKEMDGVKEEKPLYPQRYVKDHQLSKSVDVMGYSDMFVKYGKCCNPIPGDKIIGYVSRGAGVTIHRTNCPELKNCEFERLVECSWNDNGNNKFMSKLIIVTDNKYGVLTTISKKISDMKINILSISSHSADNNTVVLNIQVEVSQKYQIDDIIKKINTFSFVKEIYRS